MTTLPPYKRDVNTVFQSYALFPHLNVYENIAFGLRRKKVEKGEIDQRVRDTMKLVDLIGFESRKPPQMSGGQQQRVALARALVNHPKVLLLDEPLGALDLKLRKQMQLELKRIQQEVGITFIYVTHDQEEAMTMSDRLAVMRHWQRSTRSPAEAVYESPATESRGRVPRRVEHAGRRDRGHEQRPDHDRARRGPVTTKTDGAARHLEGAGGVRPEKITIVPAEGRGTREPNSVEGLLRMSTTSASTTSTRSRGRWARAHRLRSRTSGAGLAAAPRPEGAPGWPRSTHVRRRAICHTITEEDDEE